MILEANAYGLSFAYIQAGVIAAAVAGEDVGAVYDLFPYWTGDDVLDIQAAKAMAYFDQF